MCAKPVVTKILLDPNGSPFMKCAGSNVKEIATAAFSGARADGQKAHMHQDIKFPEHPHEWPLNLDSRPTVELDIDENAVLWATKDRATITFRLYLETDLAEVNAENHIAEVEIDGIKLQQIQDTLSKKNAPQLHKLLDQAAGNHENRSVRKFYDKFKDDCFKAQLPYLRKAFSGILKPKPKFLITIRDAVDGLTLSEKKDMDSFRRENLTLSVAGLPARLN